MAITDELRQYASYAATDRFKQSMLDIADRIDAEHERVIASVMNDALYHANEKDMAELGWVRLPKDADGEYIHVWDVMTDGLTDRCSGEVRELRLNPDGWWLKLEGNAAWLYVHEFHEWRHRHALTVEETLRKLVGRAQALGYIEDEDALVAEYAKLLQLRGDAE